MIDATPDLLKPNLVNLMTNGGFSIFRDTNYQIAFDKPVDNVLMAALMGSKFNAQPDERVTFTIAPVSSSQTRVVGDISIITNPGSGFEQMTAMNNSPESGNIQRFLDNLKVSYTPATPENRRIGIQIQRDKNKRAIIVAVIPGHPAAEAGMMAGDIVVAVDGQSVENYDAMAEAINKGTSPDAIFTIERAGEKKDLKIHYGG